LIVPFIIAVGAKHFEDEINRAKHFEDEMLRPYKMVINRYF